MSDALLEELRQRGDLLVEAPPPDAVQRESRWVLALQMAGGWLAAIFLLLFLGAGSAPFIHSASGWLVAGLLLTVAAGFGLRQAESPLFRQFLLAISLAGQAAVFFGLSDWKRGQTTPLNGYAFALFEALVFAGIAWAPHRLIAGWLALLALSTAGFHRWYDGQTHEQLVFVTVYWLGACLLSFNEKLWRRLPQARAIDLLLAALLLNVLLFCATTLFRPFAAGHGFQGLEGSWGLVLIAGPTLLFIGREVWHGQRAALAGLLLAAALALTWRAPGFAVGLTVLALGFRRGHYWMTWAGGLLALLALNRFYYDLQIDLLHKSGLLVAGGVLLLLMRALLAGAATHGEEEA